MKQAERLLNQFGLSVNILIIILLLVIIYYLHLINENLILERFSIGGQFLNGDPGKEPEDGGEIPPPRGLDNFNLFEPEGGSGGLPQQGQNIPPQGQNIPPQGQNIPQPGGPLPSRARGQGPTGQQARLPATPRVLPHDRSRSALGGPIPQPGQNIPPQGQNIPQTGTGTEHTTTGTGTEHTTTEPGQSHH